MILEDLAVTNSRISKELILKRATIWEKQIFKYAYDPALSYGVRFSDHDLELYPLVDPTERDFQLLDRLATRELSGYAAKEAVLKHCESNGSLVMYICNKKLHCGVTSTTVNKVFHGLVPQFRLQLAKEQPLSKIKFPCAAEIKYDGVRIALTVDGDEIKFRTRNSHEVNLPSLAHIVRTSGLDCTMLDMEVTLLTGKMEDRTKVSGMINSAMKGGTIDERFLVFNVFDRLSVAEFNAGTCKYEYEKRRVFIHSAVAMLQSPHFVVAEAHECHNAKAVNDFYTKVISQGYEGLILKPFSSVYKFKRTVDWTKMKETKTADLMCTGVVEGTGKYQGMIGALICEGTVEGVTVHVQAGSGLTDSDRQCDEFNYIGRLVELKYNSVIQDSVTLRHSLFLPRYNGVRLDK